MKLVSWLKKSTVVVISLCFLPLGYYLMHRLGWSKRTKLITSLCAVFLLGLFVVAAILMPPSITVDNLSSAQTLQTESSSHLIEGKIFPFSAVVTVNNEPVTVDSSNGTFRHRVSLIERDNTVVIRAVDGDKETIQKFSIYRYTAAEIIERKREKIPVAKPEVIEIEQSSDDDTPQESSPPHNVDNYWHLVTAVIDGDTIKARIDGREQTIRIIGIDSPESTTRSECYGSEASSKAKSTLSGKWIRIETDSSQDAKDKYGRLLKFVYYGGDRIDFGKQMIESGHAYEYTYDRPYKHQAAYKAAQQTAKSKSLGLWSSKTCSGNRIKPAPAPTTPPSPQPVAPPRESTSNCDPNYTPCIPRVSYDLDCGDISVSVRVIGTDHHRFDRDGDGYGCESN